MATHWACWLGETRDASDHHRRALVGQVEETTTTGLVPVEC